MEPSSRVEVVLINDKVMLGSISERQLKGAVPVLEFVSSSEEILEALNSSGGELEGPLGSSFRVTESLVSNFANDFCFHLVINKINMASRWGSDK